MSTGIGSRTLAVTLAAVLTLTLTPVPRAHAVQNTDREYNTLYAGLGAKGYDVVAYFTDGKAVEGSAEFTHPYGGVTWRFATKEHRDLFAQAPGRYAPQYGGFCAWGVAAGRLFDVDPANGWTIHDGKLYMNFNAELNGVFAADAAGYVAKAEKNWEKLDT